MTHVRMLLLLLLGLLARMLMLLSWVLLLRWHLVVGCSVVLHLRRRTTHCHARHRALIRWHSAASHDRRFTWNVHIRLLLARWTTMRWWTARVR